jgi:ABC-type phosphate transport system substrate-binding protein
MGTIGVLNLSTAARAVKAVKAAGASNYVSQLKGKRGPTHRIGTGTGIEEALAKGHYLILIWAEFTNLHKPKGAAQRKKVVSFMTEMLQKSANVSLATRMLTGSP